MYGPIDPNHQQPTTPVGRGRRHRSRRAVPAPLALGLTVTGLLAALGAGAVMLPTSVTGSGVAAEPAASVATAGQAGATEALTPAARTADTTATGQTSAETSGAPVDGADPAAPPSKAAPKPKSKTGSKATPKTTAEPAKQAGRASAARTPRASRTVEAKEDKVIELVNEARRKAGCGPVRLNEKLRTAMRRHVQDMAENHYFDHTSRNGDQPWDRAYAAGYERGGSIGENIAKGQPTPEAVMDAWMRSSGHRRNIENCGFEEIGVGLAYEGRTPVWGQLFGSR